MYASVGLQLADGTDRGKVNITATYLEILGNGYSSVSLTADLAATGKNGLDAGAESSNTWYAVHVIGDPTLSTIASLLSTSGTAPTLPSGYTVSRRVGWVRNNGSSDLYRIINAAGDDWFYYNEATNAGDFRVLSVTTSATTFTDVICFAPSTSREVKISSYLNDAAGTTLWLSLRNKLWTNSAGVGTIGVLAQRIVLSTAELATTTFAYLTIGTDASQTIQYATNVSTADCTLDMIGYRDIR